LGYCSFALESHTIESVPRQTSLLDTVWIPVKDGNPTGMDIFSGHYTARKTRKQFQCIGPGEKMMLVTPDALAVFAWRKFIDHCVPKQEGVNCAIFRNEGPVLSSGLIRDAELYAWERWPGERLYTYVDPKRTLTQARSRTLLSEGRMEARGMDQRRLEDTRKTTGYTRPKCLI
jgi:hypothetical protein